MNRLLTSIAVGIVLVGSVPASVGAAKPAASTNYNAQIKSLCKDLAYWEAQPGDNSGPEQAIANQILTDAALNGGVPGGDSLCLADAEQIVYG